MRTFKLHTFAPVVLVCLCAGTASSQVTYTDNFNTPVNYLANGIGGTIWNGVYFGNGEFPGNDVGTAAGSTLICDSSITTTNVLTVQTLQTDWENTQNDGFFLYKVISGDFSCSVHIVAPYDSGAFNTAGLMARAFGPSGAPYLGAENYVSWTRFDQFNIGNYFRNNVNGVTDRRTKAASANYWLMLERVGDTFNVYERATTNDAWAQMDTQTRADLSGRPVEVGIIDATFDDGATPRTAVFEMFSLTASNLTSVAPPAAISAVTVTTNASNKLVLSWTPATGSDGTLVVVWPGSSARKEVPANGITYVGNTNFGQGDSLPGTNYFVLFTGSGNSVTVSGLVGATTYNFAAYSYSGSGTSRTYATAPAVASAAAPAQLVSVTLNPPSAPLVAGSRRSFSVLANFDSGGSLDVSGAATVTSSNTAIVAVTGAGRLVARAVGTTALKAVYSGFTNIQTVTVVAPLLAHRYSFTGDLGATNVIDSVAPGAGDGVVVTLDASSGLNGSGQLVLSGSGSNYVQLPPNLLTNYGAVTIEAWVTDNNSGTWARVWDFGNNQTVNFFMTPQAAGGSTRVAITAGGGGGEQQVNMPGRIDPAVPVHVAYTLMGASNVARLYVNGTQVALNTAVTLTPEDLGPMANDYLGRSQYPDPYFTGNLDEFRIYDGALDPFQIALDAASGPDVLATTNTLGAMTSLAVTAGSPIQQFGFEQVTAMGTFASVPNPVNVTLAPQTKFSSSDTSVFTIDASGTLNAIGAGTATATVVSFGLTQAVQVTVTLLPPGMTHRWSFNNDFNDALSTSTPAIPHGTVSLDGSGNAILDGSGAANATTGSYIELPPNLLLGYGSVALETWYTDECGDGTGINRNWARLFDFGSGPGNNLFVTPFVAGLVDTMRFVENLNNAGEWQIHVARPITNAEHHLVMNINTTNHTATVYVDGEFAGQNRNFRVRPRDLGPTQNDWLGRSQYGDPLFAGLIDEFRIYNGTLDPLQIGIDYATGPNSIVNNPGTLTAVKVAVAANLLVGNTVNARCLVDFTGATGVPVTATSPTWASSDPTVARVDSYGRVTAVGAGTATISATFRGTAGSALVTVAAKSPVLLHRYSFDQADARDTVGGADGSVVGTPGTTPTFSNGMLNIVDNTGWISLPGHLFDTNLEVTLETWCVVASTNGSGARMADFGTSTDSDPTAGGRTAFAIAPTANGNNYIAFRPSPGDQIGTPSINSWGRPAFNTTNHYAFVISDVNRRIDMYLNGQLKDSFHYNTQPDDLMGGTVQFRSILGYHLNRMTEGWFGKNVGGAAGAGWFGSIDEFRIWSGAMDKVQAQVSYQKGPENPQIDPGVLQTLSVALSDPTMILGSVQQPTVSGTFANTTGSLDLTAFAPVTFTSDNPAVVAVINGGDTKLQALSAGTAQIVASYQGLHATNSVTVIARPIAMLTHRYSFRGDTSDSVGRASASLFGHASVAGGRLVLDGTGNPPTYARLPADLISGYDSVTFEAFYSASAGSSGSQQRLWDFGDHVAASGAVTGEGYLYEAAGRGAAGMPNNNGGGSEAAAIAPNSNQSAFTTNTTHVAVTVDSVNHILSLYTNGVWAASATNPIVDLSVVVDRFNLLGRSQWGDPAFNGSMMNSDYITAC